MLHSLAGGYGNCRISSTRVANTWRVVYYNSQDAMILNSIEVVDMPEVACAAHGRSSGLRKAFA
ncbi:MAG: hydrogenase expression/formation C-terminal domain-containing protein [Giesbergeria sp.]